MLKNYFKIALRSLIKRKFYSLLNISGLALAMACCILIYLYTSYHLSFDTYHKNADRTFSPVFEIYLDKTEYDQATSVAIVNTLKRDMPQVEQAALSINKQTYVVDVNGDSRKRFREEKNISFADSDWFNMLQFTWLEGNPKLLDQPNAVALTEKLAEKYFGVSNPVGNNLVINGQQLKIIGVLADKPHNTDLKAEMYISMLSFKWLNPQIEDNYFSHWTYLMTGNTGLVTLKGVSQKDEVERMLAVHAERHMNGDNKYYGFKLLPLKEMHFDSRYPGAIQKSLLLTLAIIGVLILFIASINYVNLIVAQQTRRSLEIGTRKVLGGSVKQLFMQFMAESFITSVLSMILAVVLTLATLPLANRFLFTHEPVHIVSPLNVIAFLGAMLVIITLATGIYPALFLSRINIFKALKNNVGNLSAGVGRKVLVVFQNTIAQCLVVCTIIIVTQVNFLKNTDKGFNRNSIITIPLADSTELQKGRLAKSLKNLPGVQSFSFCNRSPSSDSERGATVHFNSRPDWEKWPARFAIGDSAYCNTFGIKIAAGRNIRSKSLTPEFLINETMASMLHAKSERDILGKSLSAGDIKGVIVGIVKDFNVASLLQPIAPTVILEESDNLRNTIAIKLSENSDKTVEQIKSEYQKIFPQEVFTYQYVDEQIAELYKQESLQQKLIWVASSIAIFISTLGLLGLISLVTLQRTKEIGIRKVLGASVARISLMLSKDFIGLILVALVIASALSFWAMTTWLQSYAHRIEIEWWMFALGAFLAILIALLTISFQAVKAAMANPVKSLRTE